MSRPLKLRTMSWRGKLLFVLCFPLIVVVVVVFCLALVVASPWLGLRRWRRRRSVTASLGDRAVFVWSSRRGWDALIRNNVLPLLDDRSVRAVWRRRTKALPEKRLWTVLQADLHQLRCWPSVPFIASLDEKAKRFSKVTSLNAKLRPFKLRGKRSAATQEAVRPILCEAFRGHGVSLAIGDD